ncbi:hypothetical protein FQA39_LY03042 [Lamprigera yunnana]|nr:hypothetical protein FQA39_LY03042 [Lamprigera yunnana]
MNLNLNDTHTSPQIHDGIGAATAKALVEAGLIVVGLARRKDKLDDLAKSLNGKMGKMYSFRTDVTKENEILNAFKWIKDTLGPVHIVINSTGIIRNTNLVDGNIKIWKDILDTNVLGLCILTREAHSWQ